jgi:hypothetical protein
MKVKHIAMLAIVLIAAVLFASCDMISEFIESQTRPIPLIETYNSNLEKTRKMMPNDTLYVQVQGLAKDQMYRVECLDPSFDLITMFVAQSDENGIIGIRPLWYDIGFRTDENGNLSLPAGELGLRSFYIRVVDADEGTSEANESRSVQGNAVGKTDFRLPFFFVSLNENLQRPKPIVLAGKQYEGAFAMENAFFTEEFDVGPANYQSYLNLFDPDITDEEDLLEGTPLTNELFINVENMTPLFEGGENGPVRVYILPFTGDPYQDGEQIAQNAYFYKDFTVQELKDAAEGAIASREAGEESEAAGVLMPWPEEPPENTVDVDAVVNQEKIPKWAEEKAFSVFLDMMDGPAGYYNIMQQGFDSFYLDSIDGNGVAGFIVKKPPIIEPDIVSMDLASGGVFGGRYEPTTYTWGSYNYTYHRWVPTYDYRDKFIASGNDTRYSSHSGIFWGRGVKVIWNPYSTPAGWQATGHTMPSSFWGRYVDVYIVPADHSLDTDEPIVSAPGTYKCTLPVQYGCSNGYWQQTIWRAPMTVGDYMLIVDMDRSGTITDSDLVDNVRDDSGPGGFSVY